MKDALRCGQDLQGGSLVASRALRQRGQQRRHRASLAQRIRVAGACSHARQHARHARFEQQRRPRRLRCMVVSNCAASQVPGQDQPLSFIPCSCGKQALTHARPCPVATHNTFCTHAVRMLQQWHSLRRQGRWNTFVQCAVRTRAPCPRLQALDERRRARRRPHPGLRGSRLLQEVEQGGRRGRGGRIRVRACWQKGRVRRSRGGHQRAHHAGSGADSKRLPTKAPLALKIRLDNGAGRWVVGRGAKMRSIAR